MSAPIGSSRFEDTKAQIAALNKQKTTTQAFKFQDVIDKLKETESGKRFPIPVGYIDLSMNPRDEKIDEKDPEFLQLVETIKEVGILQNPVIAIIDNKIVPLLGHRRIAAAIFLKIESVVCEIRHFKEEEKNHLSALIENTARKNWNILAVSKSLRDLAAKGYNQVKLAELLGKDRKTIGRMIKVAGWHEDAHELIKKYPEKLNTRVVLDLASRKLIDEEILASLKKKSGFQENAEGSVPKVKTDKYKQNHQMALEYIKNKKLSKSEMNIVLDVLHEFGFLKKGGMQHPIPVKS